MPLAKPETATDQQIIKNVFYLGGFRGSVDAACNQAACSLEPGSLQPGAWEGLISDIS